MIFCLFLKPRLFLIFNFFIHSDSKFFVRNVIRKYSSLSIFLFMDHAFGVGSKTALTKPCLTLLTVSSAWILLASLVEPGLPSQDFCIVAPCDNVKPASINDVLFSS